MRPRAQLAFVVIILLLATLLRSYRLADLPPGVEHDEVAEWQIARGILSGQHAIFFRQAYGQEPAYLYLQAVSVALLGDNVFALRFPSLAVAMLAMAACFRLMRRLFGPAAALVSLIFIAVTLWPLFFARVAIRGMTLPLVLCLAADALFSSLRPPSSNRRFAIAGLWFGLATYTYLAARAIPILVFAFTVYLALCAREQMRGMWKGLGIMLVIAALAAAPQVVYLLGNPDIQFRVDEVSGPLKQLQQGDPSGVLAGVRDTALMFSERGDQTVRDNWPDRPVFPEPLSAGLFYIGLGVALWRWRKPAYAFMLLWLVALLLPTMVTAAPPNFVRTLGALPAIFCFPGIAVAAGLPLVKQVSKSSTFLYLVLFGALAINLLTTMCDYFIRWPAHPETQFVWQTDLATVASYLDSARNGPTDIAVAGLSNETMDDASLGLLARRRDLSVRWFDSRSALVFPSGGGRLFIPQVVPLDSLLRQTLTTLGAQQHADASGRFEWFDLTAVGPTNLQAVASTPSGVPVPLPRSLDNGMTLMGFQMPAGSLPVKPSDSLAVQTYWQAGALPLPPLKAFVHLIDAQSRLLAQSDGLSAPTQFLRNGDVIVQLHRLQIPPGAAPGACRLILGLYNSQTGVRAQFLDAGGRPLADHLLLPEIEVRP